MSLALEPRTREDGERLREGAAALADEDPSIRLREDPQTGRIELSGMGELHLEVAVERLARDFGARCPGRASPASPTASACPAAAVGRGGLRPRPGRRAGAGLASPSRLGPGAEAKRLRLRAPSSACARLPPSSRPRGAGAEAALSVGPTRRLPPRGRERRPRVGSPFPAARSRRPGKAAERAVEIAASLAAGTALREAGTRVVEPVMRLEMTVPEDFLGAAAAAVSGRGGRIESIDAAPGGRQPRRRAPPPCAASSASRASCAPAPRAGPSTPPASCASSPCPRASRTIVVGCLAKRRLRHLIRS